MKANESHKRAITEGEPEFRPRLDLMIEPPNVANRTATGLLMQIEAKERSKQLAEDMAYFRKTQPEATAAIDAEILKIAQNLCEHLSRTYNGVVWRCKECGKPIAGITPFSIQSSSRE